MNQEPITINFFKLFSLVKNHFYAFLVIPALLLGLYYFYNTTLKEDYFTSSTKILPEVSQKPNNGMAGIYGIAKSFSKGKELYSLEITSPALYSDILKSDDFYQYVISNSPRVSESINMNKKGLYALILIEFNKSSGLSIIKTRGQTPDLANELNTVAVDFLINYLKKYRTQKTLTDLKYLKNFKIDNDSINKNLVLQLNLLLQDQTPVFAVIDRKSILKDRKHLLGSYIMLFFVAEIMVFIFYLLKDKNYLSVFERTEEIKTL